jgi:hypothetical protein
MSYEHKVLFWECEHKRKMGLFRYILDSDVETELKETIYNKVGWIRVAQDRL